MSGLGRSWNWTDVLIFASLVVSLILATYLKVRSDLENAEKNQ